MRRSNSDSGEQGRRKPCGFTLPALAWTIILACVCEVDAQPQAGSAKSGAAPPAAKAADGQTVVARLNGKPIYKRELDVLVAGWTRGQSVEPATLAQLQAEALERVIGQRLLADFLQEKKLTATRAEIEGAIEQLRAQLKQQNVTLEDRLKQLGSDFTRLRNELGSSISLSKFVSEYGKPELVETYFERNKRQFDGTQLRVSHVLLRPIQSGNEAESAALRKRALDVKQEIEEGKLTFAEAARKYSAGPSRTEGGDLGLISRKGPMVEQFTRAAFDLEEGKVSDPVMTAFGVHLISVTEVKPGDKTLDDVREEVMRSFQQWLIDKLIERERKSAQIEYVDGFPHYKPGTRELAAERRN
jgi:peptidyl-prolyl cis-trans isomerase C